jgi:hypothetical protein
MSDTPTKLSGSDFAIAATVNVLLYRSLAVAINPRAGWIGGGLAGLSMAIAMDPKVPIGARKIAGAASSPGALVVRLIHSKEFKELTNSGCDCPGKAEDDPCRC